MTILIMNLTKLKYSTLISGEEKPGKKYQGGKH